MDLPGRVGQLPEDCVRGVPGGRPDVAAGGQEHGNGHSQLLRVPISGPGRPFRMRRLLAAGRAESAQKAFKLPRIPDIRPRLASIPLPVRKGALDAKHQSREDVNGHQAIPLWLQLTDRVPTSLGSVTEMMTGVQRRSPLPGRRPPNPPAGTARAMDSGAEFSYTRAGAGCPVG